MGLALPELGRQASGISREEDGWREEEEGILETAKEVHAFRVLDQFDEFVKRYNLECY